MPYVTPIGTYVPCHVGARRPMAEVGDFFTGNELISYEDVGFAEGCGGLQTHRSGSHDHQWGMCYEAQISLVHNSFRSTAESAVIIVEGATYGAG